jgi:IMP dehydrogenase
MNFLNNISPTQELTYSDVFMVPQKSAVASRFDVSVLTPDTIGTTIPIVVANMNAVSGKRMAETVARRGGVAVLPQDAPADIIQKNIAYIKQSNLIYETPVTLQPHDTIARAMDLIHKRAHKAVIIIDKHNVPVGIFTERDSLGHDRFTKLSKVMSGDVITITEGKTLHEMYQFLDKERLHMAPVVNANNYLVGVVTQKGIVRSDIYTPAVNSKNELLTAAAIGVNGDPAQKALELDGLGVDIIVIDTAHGHQDKMIQAIKDVRKALGTKKHIIAGNVATAQATKELIVAGASGVKVGIGPGAMCTTRMMTGVGRPQFSAVVECAIEAKQSGGFVWADGGVKHPRDVALAIAAGASNVMIGSWFAGTFESAADTLQDADGRLYKENYGMASRRAVKGRTEQDGAFARAKKELFEEGISASRLYLDDARPGVEDIIDSIIAGLRSAMAYAGATTIADFQDKAVIGIQSAAGYSEGLPVKSSW